MTRYLAAAALTVALLVPVAVVAFGAWAEKHMSRHPDEFPFRGADPARRMSPGYLSRHPNVAAHLADDTTETEEAA